MLGTLQIPATVIVGGGARLELVAQLQRFAARRPLVVTDPGVLRIGAAAELIELLRTAQIEPSIFDRVQPDPTDRNVNDGVAQYKADGCDALIAIGGGSPIDAAKAIGVSLTNPGPLEQFAGYHRVERPGPPLLAVPTTAGTGSEVTRVAVITDTQRDVKMMMLSVQLTPTVALVDYELSMTMPPALTAAVGIDTLTHGIEAYVSRRAHGLTDPLALSCIGLVARYLRRAFAQGDDREARAGMMLAACQGGMAFANASVCLVHGMSRPIGAVYHVPHGLSNAVLLPTVTRFSWSAAVERYATVARCLGCCSTAASDAEAAESLVAALEQFNVDLQVPRLRDCVGVSRAQFDLVASKMAHDALASGSPQNNPRVPTADEIVTLYGNAW